MRSPVLAVAALLVLAAVPLEAQTDAPAARSRAFEVRLARPFVAGDRHRLTLAYTTDLELLVTGGRRAAEGHTTLKVELTADADVVTVNDRGQPTLIRLTVVRGSYSAKRDVIEDLAPGQVLTVAVSKINRATVTQEPTPLSPEAATLFAEALPYNNTLLADKSEPAAFGSAEPRKVGESWPLDAALLSDLTPRRILLDRAAMSGTMTLQNVVKFRDVPCLKVRLRSALPHYAPPDGVVGGVVPRGHKFTDGSIACDFTAYYPLDAKRQPLRYTETIRATATAQSNGKRMQSTAATHSTRVVDIAP